MMKAPLIVVTGPIASGKSTVARVIAGRGGYLADADRIAHEILGEKEIAKKLFAAFGSAIFTPSGKVSRKKLGAIVFADPDSLDLLNRLIRPSLKKKISELIREKRQTEKYIVLDAVLYFQYKFRFRADLVVMTRAAEKIRIKRLEKRNNLSYEQALMRIKRQKGLARGWTKSDIVIDTSGSIRESDSAAAKVRDEFLQRMGITEE